MKPAPSIHLHIEELVLEGFPEHQRAEIAASLTSELQRLLGEHGLPETWRQDSRQLDGGKISLTSRAPLGRQIAGAVYRGTAQ